MKRRKKRTKYLTNIFVQIFFIHVRVLYTSSLYFFFRSFLPFCLFSAPFSTSFCSYRHCCRCCCHRCRCSRRRRRLSCCSGCDMSTLLSTFFPFCRRCSWHLTSSLSNQNKQLYFAVSMHKASHNNTSFICFIRIAIVQVKLYRYFDFLRSIG